MKEILTVRQSEHGYWAYTPSVGICGNQSLEKVIKHIDQSLETQSSKPWDFYLWKSQGQRWGDDDQLIEECDQWHLSRYEVCSAPDESRYQAVVILYYEPVVKVAIAV